MIARFRICRQHSAGLEYAGLVVSAPSADEAVSRARFLFPHLAGVRQLVAIQEQSS